MTVVVFFLDQPIPSEEERKSDCLLPLEKKKERDLASLDAVNSLIDWDSTVRQGAGAQAGPSQQQGTSQASARDPSVPHTPAPGLSVPYVSAQGPSVPHPSELDPSVPHAPAQQQGFSLPETTTAATRPSARDPIDPGQRPIDPHTSDQEEDPEQTK